MTTVPVPQPYVYPISGIPGGQFTGQTSDHLLDLILTNLPGDTNPVITSDNVNVTITFDADISTNDKTTLDGLVQRSADYFIVTKDNGITDLGLPALVSVVAGLLSSTTVTIQYKNGDGTNSNGYGDSINITAPIMEIDKLSGIFNGSGKFQFIIGAELSRGTAMITIQSGSLPVRELHGTWT